MIVILLVATLAYILLMGGGARGIPYQLSFQITVHGCSYLATYIANAQRQSLYNIQVEKSNQTPPREKS